MSEVSKPRRGGKKHLRSGVYQMVEPTVVNEVDSRDAKSVRAMMGRLKAESSFVGRLDRARGLVEKYARAVESQGEMSVDFALDSQASFLEEVSNAIAHAKSVLDDAEMAESILAIKAFMAGHRLACEASVYREEFVLTEIASGRTADASIRKAAAARRVVGDRVRDAAREYIKTHPKTTQLACARHVAADLDRNQRGVERIIEALFEWRDLPGGGREKRPRRIDD